MNDRLFCDLAIRSDYSSRRFGPLFFTSVSSGSALDFRQPQCFNSFHFSHSALHQYPFPWPKPQLSETLEFNFHVTDEFLIDSKTVTYPGSAVGKRSHAISALSPCLTVWQFLCFWGLNAGLCSQNVVVCILAKHPEICSHIFKVHSCRNLVPCRRFSVKAFSWEPLQNK